MKKIIRAKQLLTFCLSLTCLSATATTTIPIQLAPGFNTIQIANLKKDLAFLTSNSLQGRLALTAGDERATQWLVKQFADAGLQPAFGNSYLQPVALIQYDPDEIHSYVQLERDGNVKQWKKPQIFSQFYNNIDVNSELVFAGYGITAPDLKYDDYQSVDVRGKIVLMFEHEPQERNPHSIFNGTGNTCYATTRIKALNAQQHGAIAVLIAPEPNRKHPSNQERYASIGGSVARSKELPSQVLLDNDLKIPVAILSDAVAKEIVGKQMSLSALQSAIDSNLMPQSQLIPGVKIKLHDRNHHRQIGTTYNVVGLLEGSDASLKNETIILSAHHDHDGMDGQKIWRGADDNASGSTGVVNLARAIAINNAAKNGLQIKRSILFVVFAAEESGLLGSAYMAKHPLRPLATTRAMLNFDMIGRNEAATPQTNGLIAMPADTTNRLNLIGGHYSPEYKQTVEEQNKSIGLILDDRFDNESALNTFFRSDQFPFVLHHIPAFWWFTGFHPDYHHTTDTADKINYGKMQRILQLAYLTTFVFTNEKQSPVFVKNPGLD